MATPSKASPNDVPETVFLPPDMTPDAWARYLSALAPEQKITVSKQNAILAGFAKGGSIRKVAPGAQITRQQVYNWIQGDSHHFKSRLEQASHSFREYLQDLALAKVEDHPKTHDILHITMLNAAWPEKYRRDTVIIGQDSSKELLAELRALKRQQMELAASVEVTPIEVGAEAKIAKALGPGEAKGNTT